MTLQLDVVVVAECVLEPFDLSLGLFDFSGLYQSRYFAAKTGRAHDEPLAVVVESFLVGSRMRVEAFGPCLRHYLDEVVIARFVFREHDEVTARVLLVDMLMQRLQGHIHFASEYGLEYFFIQLGDQGLVLCHCFVVVFLACFGYGFFSLLYFVFNFSVFLFYVVEELFYAKHVSVVGDGESFHSVGNGLVDERRY